MPARGSRSPRCERLEKARGRESLQEDCRMGENSRTDRRARGKAAGVAAAGAGVAACVAGTLVQAQAPKPGPAMDRTVLPIAQPVRPVVPAPQGAALAVLPASRVLVGVGHGPLRRVHTFYRRVMNGAQEQFVVVTAPAGVVFVQALPADFEVVQLNTMYFEAGGRYYVPFLTPDGKELYVMVDAPPRPCAAAISARWSSARWPAASARTRRRRSRAGAASATCSRCAGGLSEAPVRHLALR
jgi:hypothetical protein